MADFTGQNIQDTYQRVVQVDGNQLQDGTGSVLPISFDGNDVVIPGALRAESYIVSQSTTIATSGSTIFGNSHDDTHTFSGSVNIGDRVNSNYNAINTSLFVRQDAVDRSQIANGFGGAIDFHIQRGSSTNGARSGRIANRLTTGAQGSSDFYALDFGIRSNDTQIDLMTLHSDSSNTAGRVGILDTTPSYTLDVNGTFRTTGNAILGNASSDSHTINGSISNVNTTHVTASGQISASNTVTGQTLKTSTGNIIGDESFSTQLVVNGPITSSAISASGNVSAIKIFLNNIDTLRYSTLNSGLYVNGGIQTVGNSTFGNTSDDTHTFTGNITASSDISASGNVIAAEVHALNMQINSQRLTISNDNLTLPDTGLSVSSHITASGNISSSGTIVGSNLSGTNTGDQDLSSLALKTAVSGAFVAPSASFSTRVTANDAKVSYTNAAVTTVINDAGVLSSSAQINSDISGSLGANASLIRSLTAASISGSVTTVSSSLANRTTTLESTTANRTFNHITASGNISASGNIYAQTIYGHQFETFTSNFAYNFPGYAAALAGGDDLDNMVFMPISDQSTAEHATSATNINISRASVVPGRPIKTTIRNATNTNLNQWEITCSVFYNQPGQGSSGATPGDTNSGQKHLVTSRAKGAASNHNAIELDFTNPDSGSWEDLPAGSRMYMTLAVSTDGGGDPGNTTYIVSNLWRWDYSQL